MIVTDFLKQWRREFILPKSGASWRPHLARLSFGLVILSGIPVAFGIHYGLRLLGFRGLFQLVDQTEEVRTSGVASTIAGSSTEDS